MQEIKNTYNKITIFSSYVFVSLVLSIVVLVLAHTSYTKTYFDTPLLEDGWYYIFNFYEVYAILAILCINWCLWLIVVILIFIQYFKLHKKIQEASQNEHLGPIYIRDMHLLLGTFIFSLFFLIIALISMVSSFNDFFNNEYVDVVSTLTIVFNYVLHPIFSIVFCILFITIFSKSISRVYDINWLILRNNNNIQNSYNQIKYENQNNESKTTTYDDMNDCLDKFYKKWDTNNT